MRRGSNWLDNQYYERGKNWIDNAYWAGARPITHGIWHGAAGVGKWIGSQFGHNYNYGHEFDRSGIQFGRIGQVWYRKRR